MKELFGIIFEKEVAEKKFCNICKEYKLQIEFGSKEIKCKPCKKQYDAIRYSKNREEVKTKVKLYRSNNKEKIKESSKEYKKQYRIDNKEKISKQDAEYREKNKDKIKQWFDNNKNNKSKYDKLYQIKNKDKIKEYRKENKERYCNLNAKRRAILGQAAVFWANDKKIESIYLKAKELEQQDGIKRHVDHIVPLQGKNVCGLHVENNLQILTAHENHKKSNKFIG
jgi:hypothetical protein